MADRLQRGARPALACEVLPDRVIAARVSTHHDFIEVYDSRPLPASAVAPSLASPNVADSGALCQAISGAIGAVAGRGRDLVAVIPDAAVRLFLLDFDSFPDRPHEADAVVRFRLRKSLPFDVDRAALSYEARRDNGAVHVVAAVTLTSVLAEYESAFREAGYHPGFVLPSMLAALGTVEADRPTLVAKVDSTTVTVAILDRRKLRLLRTLENTHGSAIEEAHLADEVYPSLVFYQDTYGAGVERVLVAGIPSLSRFADALHAHTSASVEPLVTGRYLGASLAGDLRRDSLAGVVGALVA
jgi:type IV pilus assembly protein PilM